MDKRTICTRCGDRLDQLPQGEVHECDPVAVTARAFERVIAPLVPSRGLLGVAEHHTIEDPETGDLWVSIRLL
jgi:hypothetical protein